MKTFNREFTNREKVLLLVMVLIIIGAFYYLMVYEPVSRELEQARVAKLALEEELMVAETKAARIWNMQNEMKAAEERGLTHTYMPSYNASKQEIDFLHNVLSAKTVDYLVNFTQVTRSGNQIRRNFSLSFTVSDYKTAENIIKELEKCEIRCLVGDMSISSSGDTILSGDVNVGCVATFYETMYEGITDSELPTDSSQSKAVSDTGE